MVSQVVEARNDLAELIFDNTPSAIIIYEVINGGSTSMDYIIRSANPACLTIEGWQHADIVGKPLGELRPGAEEFGIVKAFQEALKTGEAVHFPAKVYQENDEYRWFENIIFTLPTGEIIAVYNDITEQKLAAEALFAEKEKLSITLYSIGDGVITTDEKGRVEILNPVAEQLTGWHQKEAAGKPLSAIFDIYNEFTGEPVTNPVKKVLEKGETVGLANHTALVAKDGCRRAIADSAAPIKDSEGNILGVVLVFRDVTEAKEKEARIEFLSCRDALTGLYNRAFFDLQLEKLDNEGCFPSTLIMGDLDGFKLINDVFGHHIGDEALQQVARTIETSCREHDIVARWGGDEFVILLPKASESMAENICDRISAACSSIKIRDTKLSISLGSATKNHAGEPWHEILKTAEDNMYGSKLLGERSFRSTILASVKTTLFAKSFETQEHGERLGHFCRQIGKTLGLSVPQLDELEVLAMLHDIGKVAIDDHILQKPGQLNEEEWDVIKKHPETGYRIAQAIPDLVNIADYILAHHERWDGKGYPRGLAGEDIPLLSRILSVVDAFDAMTQDRSYRKALSIDAARQELIDNAGTQFDPEIVAIFLDCLNDHNPAQLPSPGAHES